MTRLPSLRMFLFALACVFVATGVVRAADITPALTQASKMMQNGAYVRAIEIITAALSSNKVSTDLAAKALLMRAQSNEKLGRTAFALADYNQAVWMQGLSGSDKKAAEQGRLRVQASLGVTQAGEKRAAAAGSRGRSTARRESSSEESGFFSNLFGSSKPAKKQERPQRPVMAVVHQERPAAKSHPAAGPSTAARTSVRSTRLATNATSPAAEAASVEPTGSFAIQFAALLSERSAIHEVNRIAKRYGADLNGRSPEVYIVPTREGGTLYKIVAGPYEKAEGQATCELLKTKNVSCMLITRRQ